VEKIKVDKIIKIKCYILMFAKIKTFVQRYKVAIGSVAGAIAGIAFTFPANADLISTTSASDATFLATTGFSMSDLVTKVGTWIMMFLGGGLGLVDAMMGWIIALIVISVIIGLIYKAMRFLHILH
jgi:hypothetical protein